MQSFSSEPVTSQPSASSEVINAANVTENNSDQQSEAFRQLGENAMKMAQGALVGAAGGAAGGFTVGGAISATVAGTAAVSPLDLVLFFLRQHLLL